MRTTRLVLALLVPLLAVSNAACADSGRYYRYGDGGYSRSYRPAPIHRAPAYDSWVHPQFGPSYRSWQHPGHGWGRPAYRHWGNDRGFGHYRHDRGAWR